MMNKRILLKAYASKNVLIQPRTNSTVTTRDEGSLEFTPEASNSSKAALVSTLLIGAVIGIVCLTVFYIRRSNLKKSEDVEANHKGVGKKNRPFKSKGIDKPVCTASQRSIAAICSKWMSGVYQTNISQIFASRFSATDSASTSSCLTGYFSENPRASADTLAAKSDSKTIDDIIEHYMDRDEQPHGLPPHAVLREKPLVEPGKDLKFNQLPLFADTFEPCQQSVGTARSFTNKDHEPCVCDQCLSLVPAPVARVLLKGQEGVADVEASSVYSESPNTKYDLVWNGLTYAPPGFI